jgi:hypothetical protein
VDPATAALDVPGGRGPGWPAPSQQRQRPRGQRIARSSAHRLLARGRPAPPPGRLAHRPVLLANLDATLDALIVASQDASGAADALRKVERTLADCQRNLARYRAALDAEAMISARSVQLMARQESV